MSICEICARKEVCENRDKLVLYCDDYEFEARACMLELVPNYCTFFRCAKCKGGFFDLIDLESGEVNYCSKCGRKILKK